MESISISKALQDALLSEKKEAESIEDFISRLLEIKRHADTSLERRILVLGPANAGKSTIRMLFFEDADPSDLLEEPLEPTRGIETYTYDWLDLKIGVADSSGQEIETWFTSEAGNVFPFTDAIIYVFSMPDWETDKEAVFTQLQRLIEVKNLHAPDAKIFVFVHKKDTISIEERAKRFLKIQDEVFMELKGRGLKEPFEFYNTSVRADFAIDLVRTLRYILYRYSAVLRRALVPIQMR